MRYKYNVDFFKTQSRDLGYFLGFLTADGYVSKKYGRVAISLNPKDKEVLEFFKVLICPNKPIWYKKQLHKKSNKYLDTVTFGIGNAEITKILVDEYGIHSPKTGYEIFPIKLDKRFYPDFIRGVFDGDGCITFSPTGCIISSICSASKEFINSIEQYLGFGRIHTTKSGIYEIKFGQKNSFKLMDIIYNNESFALSRKKQRFIDRMNIKKVI